MLEGGALKNGVQPGVSFVFSPEDATYIHFDVIRSFDRPLLNSELLGKIGNQKVKTELDWQLYQLQRRYLDYQVNIGNRIIELLTGGKPEDASEVSRPKTSFQNLIDDLFSETGKKIIRKSNEILFEQDGDTLTPYQLSSGEKTDACHSAHRAGTGQPVVCALHGRTGNLAPRRMAAAPHLPHPEPESARADHPHHALSGSHHERMD